MNAKPIKSLSVVDVESHPVWKYTSPSHSGEVEVRPVKHFPVKSLVGAVVASQILLANSTRVWSLIGNVEPLNPHMTEHFLTLSVEKDGQWFTLSRYHDFDYSENGPVALAKFLGLAIEDVFPIAYDITDWVIGDSSALAGRIPKEPRQRLTRAEIIARAVP